MTPNGTTATQTRHPWRATVRTIAAALIGLIVILPPIVEAAGLGAVPWVASAVTVAAAITRVLAIPAVNDWLRDYVPWLSAEGRDP